METHGVVDWGGPMLEKRYIEGITGVESLGDSIEKIAPAVAAAGKLAVGAAAGAAVDYGKDQLVQAAKERLSGKEKEVATATQELASAEEQAKNNATVEANRQKTEAGQGVGLRGMDNPESDTPDGDQEGTEVNAPDKTGLNQDPNEIKLSIDRNWFVNNFGMTGSEMASLLILKNELSTLDALYPLLIQEKQAILSSFPGVSPSLVKSLPLTDVDYDNLNRYSDRLGIPFRRFVKMWSGANDPSSQLKSYQKWREVIDADLRLSMRERSILKQCADLLLTRGALNAQTLKFNGVSASPAEISSLIKSHGFLFDIISVGEVSKSVGRGLFYDVKRRDVILKDAGRFIAGLIENHATVKYDSRYNPRLELSFSAPTAPWYATALNQELGVDAVTAASHGLCIQGEEGIRKAFDLSYSHIENPKTNISLLKRAIDGDDDAMVIITHDSLKKKDQVAFLKSKNIGVEAFDKIKEGVF